VVELLLAKQVVVGSIPILRSNIAPVVQLVEAPDLGSGWWEFESLQGHQRLKIARIYAQYLI